MKSTLEIGMSIIILHESSCIQMFHGNWCIKNRSLYECLWVIHKGRPYFSDYLWPKPPPITVFFLHFLDEFWNPLLSPSHLQTSFMDRILVYFWKMGNRAIKKGQSINDVKLFWREEGSNLRKVNHTKG